MLVLSLLPQEGCGSDDGSRRDGTPYTVEHINNISITRPEEALALLDTAENKGFMSAFDIARLRCLTYHNGLSDYKTALRYGKEAYDMPEARNDPQEFLLLMELLADESLASGEYAESVGYCTEGLRMAIDNRIPSSEANFNVTLGQNLLEQHNPEEAFSHFEKAVMILDSLSEKDDTYGDTDNYIYALGILINSLCDEGRISEALTWLPRYDEALGRLEHKRSVPEGLADMRRASGYAAFAYMSALDGDTAGARRLYDMLCDTDWASGEYSSQLKVPYLLATARYSEAIGLISEEKKFWYESADTVSYSYIEDHLANELQAYEGLGDTAAANRVLHEIIALSDTLHARDRRENALELAEIYKTSEQAVKIEKQSASITLRNIIIIFSIILLAVAIFFIVRVIRFNRAVSRKNEAMVKTIDELIVYKEELFRSQEEVFSLRSQLEECGNQSAPATGGDTGADADTTAPDNSSGTGGVREDSTDGRLFDRVNHEILARRLFLNPDFSKKDLLAEFRIPANKFSTLFKEHAGCSFTCYIQNCRIDYAVKLMRENPQWNLEAVAREARMSNGAFYSHFKRRFGMSPSDYQNLNCP